MTATAVFTRDEVASHCTDDSNWIIIDDKVRRAQDKEHNINRHLLVTRKP